MPASWGVFPNAFALPRCASRGGRARGIMIDYALETDMKILKAGIIYFILVFGAGFVFGPIRLLWAVPRFGTRVAELMETPLMIAVILVAARWVVRRLALPPTLYARLTMGCIALCLMVTAEFALVLRLRGLSLGEYLAGRDPVSGTVYYMSLGVFALMPLLVARR